MLKPVIGPLSNIKKRTGRFANACKLPRSMFYNTGLKFRILEDYN